MQQSTSFHYTRPYARQTILQATKCVCVGAWFVSVGPVNIPTAKTTNAYVISTNKLNHFETILSGPFTRMFDTLSNFTLLKLVMDMC